MQDLEYFKLELKKPLLIIKAKNGILGCGYVNVEVCNRTGDACAIVTGVNQFEEMLTASVVAISENAAKLGINIGDSGKSALHKLA